MVKDLFTSKSLGVTGWAVGGEVVPRKRRSSRPYTKLREMKLRGDNHWRNTMRGLDPHETPQIFKRGNTMNKSGRTLGAESTTSVRSNVSRDDRASPIDFERNLKRQPSSEPDALAGVRLSLVGLDGRLSSSNGSSSPCREQRDELHSELYSSVLETLRVKLLECLPQLTEGMVSRAIIGAFASKSTSKKTDASDGEADRYQIEVDHLWKAHQWTILHQASTGEELKGLQQCLDEVCAQIHKEELTSSDHALRIVLSFASILGLDVDESVYIPQDTILIKGLSQSTTKSSLSRHLSNYGQVKTVAIANNGMGFAFCRFREEDSALRIMACGNSFSVDGVNANIRLLYASCGEDKLFVNTHEPDLAKHRSKTPVPNQEESQISPVCVSKFPGPRTSEESYFSLIHPPDGERPSAWSPH